MKNALISAALQAQLQTALNVSLENAEEPVPGVNPDDTPGDTSADGNFEVGVLTVADVIEFDEAKEELAETLKDVEGGERDLEILTESEEKVEQLVASTEALLAGGATLSLEQAQLIIMRAHAAMCNVGLEELSEKTTPSLEQFSADKDRGQVSLEALDNLKAKAGAIAGGVKNIVLKIVEFISNLINGLLKNTGALSKRAKALIQAVDAVDKAGKKAAGGMPTYNNGGILSWKREVDAKSVKAGLIESAKNFETLLDGSVEALKAANKFNEKNVGKLVIFQNEIDDYKASVFKNPKLNGLDFIGGYTFNMTPKTETTGNSAFERVDANVSKMSESKVPALGDIKGLGLAVIEVVAALDSRKAALKTLKDENASLAKQLADNNGRDAADKVYIKFLAWASRTGLSSSAAKVAAKLYNAASAALSYGEKALAQYKEEKAA